ncbi:putative beta-hydroxydecanoyl thiol ester dehydrase, FabA/FabZ, HotDog domain superfamily [Helianthus annuus]|nr:putative beta-hydroxydecanoyl thiol ester dehydrase, FabA/FabZ, HotDog domain superfamily [Helianthus annuus]
MLVVSGFPAFPTLIDINQIREILPHRFPFLLVDRVIEYNPGVSAGVITPHEGGGQVTVVEWWLCRTYREKWVREVWVVYGGGGARMAVLRGRERELIERKRMRDEKEICHSKREKEKI